ncbi:MAG: hypothetical protein JRE18_08780 [Deltaproteobacteria bacterium]|jgi:hypothetical protein|nr:hypothetical protein [Deltaproteobacteria bacterium]
MALGALGPAVGFLAKYATPVLATGGALLGGKAAYEQSGGDLGAAALGAGTGALGLGALPGVGRRMANAPGIQKGLVESGAAQKAGQLAQQLQGKGKLGSPLQQQMLGQQIIGGLGAAGLGAAGLYAVPHIAGTVGQGAKALTPAAGAGANQLIKTAQGDFVVNPLTGEAVPATPGLPGLIDYQNPLGPYQANLGFQRDLYRLGREELGKQLEMLQPVIDDAKKREFERQMAGARYRTDLSTQQGLTLQGQRGAQAMAQTGLAGGIQGLTQQYQYG